MGERPSRAGGQVVVLAALGVLISACSVPVAANLNESDANHAVVALETGGVVSQKERDPDSEGHFRVVVSRDDAAAAVSVLAQENLPPSAAPGVLEALGQGSMVPSRLSEHAKFIAGISGELERSLRELSGVVAVRVHLAVPPRDALALEEKPPRPSASVLLRHRGASPPISTQDVQRLVAGAIPGLLADQVSVIATPAPAAPRPPERELLRFGPITVTRGSMLSLRILVSGVVLLNVLLIGILAVLWTRLRRAESSLTLRG